MDDLSLDLRDLCYSAPIDEPFCAFNSYTCSRCRGVVRLEFFHQRDHTTVPAGDGKPGLPYIGIIRNLLRANMNWEALATTLELASITAIILALASLPLSYWVAFSRRRWKFIVEAVVALP